MGKKGWVFQTPFGYGLTPSVSQGNAYLDYYRGMSASRVHACDSISQSLTLIKRRSQCFLSFFFLLHPFLPPAEDVHRPDARNSSLRGPQPTFFSPQLGAPSSALASSSLRFSSRRAARGHLLSEVSSGGLGAPKRGAARACSVRKWHRGTRSPKSPQRDPTSQSVSFDYY